MCWRRRLAFSFYPIAELACDLFETLDEAGAEGSSSGVNGHLVAYGGDAKATRSYTAMVEGEMAVVFSRSLMGILLRLCGLSVSNPYYFQELNHV